MSTFPKDLCIPLRSELNEFDNEKQTFGCRQNNPNICGFCYVENVCAFNSKDKICKHPSRQWKKIYNELKTK